MYYLLEQKHHAKRLKKAESAKLQIRQNSSNLSKPETGSEPGGGSGSDATRRDASSNAPQGAQAQVRGASQNPFAIQNGQKAAAPLKMMLNEPLAPIVANAADGKSKENQEKSVPIKTFLPITPYLQAPAILQQQQPQQQQQQRPYQNNMPSLDLYLKGGMDMQIGAQAVTKNNSTNGSNSVTNSSVASTAKPLVTPSGGVNIPPLNLRVKSSGGGGGGGNSTSAAMAAATGNSMVGGGASKAVVYTSQTARGPAQQPSSQLAVEDAARQPSSARAALPSGKLFSVFFLFLTVITKRNASSSL